VVASVGCRKKRSCSSRERGGRGGEGGGEAESSFINGDAPPIAAVTEEEAKSTFRKTKPKSVLFCHESVVF
jgi:hypothetical protein